MTDLTPLRFSKCGQFWQQVRTVLASQVRTVLTQSADSFDTKCGQFRHHFPHETFQNCAPNILKNMLTRTFQILMYLLARKIAREQYRTKKATREDEKPANPRPRFQGLVDQSPSARVEITVGETKMSRACSCCVALGSATSLK